MYQKPLFVIECRSRGPVFEVMLTDALGKSVVFQHEHGWDRFSLFLRGWGRWPVAFLRDHDWLLVFP